MMIRKFAWRYRLILLIFGFLTMTSILFFYQKQPHTPEVAPVIPPAQIIIKQATVVEQGVQIEWLEGQAGTNAIAGYVIERSRDKNDFEQVARVEGIFLDYLDADGQEADEYRIIAEDSGQSAAHSPASETIAATLPKPGSAVVIVPDTSRVLNASTDVEQAKTPDAKAGILKHLITQTFKDFDTALNRDDIASAKKQLNTLQRYQQQVLSMWARLSPSKKASLAQACTDQQDVFETNLYLLPEDDQLDGLLVIAGCNAMQENT